MYISSPNNQRLKDLRKLEKASERKTENVVLLEGLREVNLAYRAGYTFRTVFICEKSIKETEHYNTSFLKDLNNVELITLSPEAYSSIAYRESTEGIIAVVEQKGHTLSHLRLSENPLVLVIEGVEKPGNFGAMLRTCDATKVDAVIICDAKTDVYNPNVIRSSIGTVFTNQIAVDSTWNVIAFLKEKGIETYAAYLETELFYYGSNFKIPTAIVVGTEAEGLSSDWISQSDHHVKIPMLGEIDSLNVSVSAAVLLYEVVRQRQFKI